jgi:FG-GAP-like repeat
VKISTHILAAGVTLLVLSSSVSAAGLQRVKFNNPGLVVDLGVGLWAWPMPMDWDGDGDLDLVVSCPDVPSNGTYFFENTSGKVKMPVFKPGVRVGPGLKNVQVSYVDGRPRVLTPSTEWEKFLGSKFEHQRRIYNGPAIHRGKIRANQWRYVDYDGDGKQDLIVGVGDWAEYGWDNAFNARGQWTRGPLHGHVYLLRNEGTNARPKYAASLQVQAGGKPVDVFGMPSPNFADFDGDGDLDLLCGEFLDGFTYFQNVGTRTKPRYAAGRRLTRESKPIRMDLQMITPTAIDWDGDGDMDLIVGDEDGRVALIEHTGRVVDGMPQFDQPRYFQQQADDLKFGALATPVSVDWDGDGDEDLICGNSAGYIAFIENLDGGNPPRWAAPVLLKAADEVIRIQAGSNGSIQGPAEAKWGYTTLSVADWDHDGQPDLVVNSIWGKVVWYRNVGTRKAPKLAAAQSIEVQWKGRPPRPAWNWWAPKGKELVTQWRTTPLVVDWNRGGLNDLLMLDHEGYLCLFRRERRAGQLVLLPGERLFLGGTFDSGGKQTARGGPLRLNDGTAGKSGRRKFCVTDWDGDGRLDLLVNSRNVNWLRNVRAERGRVMFEDRGPVDGRRLAGHTTSPTTVDWDGNGVRDLLVGAEDGRFYYLANPRSKLRDKRPGRGQ